jgi:uncharacterized membrane protein
MKRLWEACKILVFNFWRVMSRHSIGLMGFILLVALVSGIFLLIVVVCMVYIAVKYILDGIKQRKEGQGDLLANSKVLSRKRLQVQVSCPQKQQTKTKRREQK